MTYVISYCIPNECNTELHFEEIMYMLRTRTYSWVDAFRKWQKNHTPPCPSPGCNNANSTPYVHDYFTHGMGYHHISFDKMMFNLDAFFWGRVLDH